MKDKICTICNQPVKVIHPAQKYHDSCKGEAVRRNEERYRAKVEASQLQNNE